MDSLLQDSEVDHELDGDISAPVNQDGSQECFLEAAKAVGSSPSAPSVPRRTSRFSLSPSCQL
jgi:hypothetical protein